MTVVGTMAEGLREFRRILASGQVRRWPMYLRNVKQLLRQVNATFDERAYGFANLVDLLRAAAKENLVRVDRDRQGVVRVFQGTASLTAPEVPESYIMEIEAELAAVEARQNGGAASAEAETVIVTDEEGEATEYPVAESVSREDEADAAERAPPHSRPTPMRRSRLPNRRPSRRAGRPGGVRRRRRARQPRRRVRRAPGSPRRPRRRPARPAGLYTRRNCNRTR